MKIVKIAGLLALVALLVPLSGCIGGDDPPSTPKVSGETEVLEGAPPDKFTFESVRGSASGEVTREWRERPSGFIPLPPFQTMRSEWKFSWNITGLQDLGASEDGEKIGEAFYAIWLGQPSDEEEGVTTWELLAKSETFAKDGEISGETGWTRGFGDYVGLRVTLEVKADSKMEVPLLETTAFASRTEDVEKHPLQDLKPFGAAFADAKVVTNQEGKVNLTVSAISLPESEGSYDLFLRNAAGDHYLGSLRLDPATGGMSLAIQPDAKLFTKYQFFISLEHGKEKKDEVGGYQVMKSSFKS